MTRVPWDPTASCNPASPSSWPEALTSGRERQKYLIEEYLFSPPTNKPTNQKNALTLSKHPCHVRFFEIFSRSTLPSSHEGRRPPIQVLQYPTCLLVFREMAPFVAIYPFLFDPFSTTTGHIPRATLGRIDTPIYSTCLQS